MIARTKARTLQYLQKQNMDIHIAPVFILSSQDFNENRENILVEIIRFSQGHMLIVRSSAKNEDMQEYSYAGQYTSVLNVQPEKASIEQAVEEVYQSYHTDENEEILIQWMIEGVIKSGVMFTADMDTYAPYDIINYSEGKSTHDVTDGSGYGLRTLIRYRYAEDEIPDKGLAKLIRAGREIEKILGSEQLDIEFAITEDVKVYILQVRAIAQGAKDTEKPLDLSMVLNRIDRKITKLSRRHPFLLGETTYFGVMPDWNPAEILGIRPRKLAISLYKELITDSIWAHQRSNYGYRDLTMHPLMVSFCGVPYIDTRITFNSFIPGKLNEKIAEKLVNYYLGQLKSFPKYHDKIEFEIVFSCYYIGISEKLKKLLDFGFNENEIKRIEYALLEITNDMVDPKEGLYKRDIEKVQILEADIQKILESDISLVDKIYWLIEVCKKYGTLAFAGVARAGFVAVQFLQSFVENGILSEKQYNDYMESLHTVSKEMAGDAYALREGKIDKQIFLEKYGHIRPGTYDILSKRYDEGYEEYFSIDKINKPQKKHKAFKLKDKEKQRIQTELEQGGMQISVDELFVFFKESIEGRESIKFSFTKAISEILRLIEELGKRVQISREDMSYVDITVIKQLYSDLYCGDVRSAFETNIEANKIQHRYSEQIKLPAIITSPESIYQFYLLEEEPNFVTRKSVVAETVLLEEQGVRDNLKGKIVLIRAADPGYDFVFSKGIGGLITQFGGANSHMAIRCAELGIPAVIGVGEKNYKEWSQIKYMSLDCSKKQVVKLR